MNALCFDGKTLQLLDRSRPQAGEQEALIKVLYSGICNTDLEILKGYMDFRGIIGHEFVGRVEEAPYPELTGKTVVGEINLACGHCEYCAAGLDRHCPNRTVLGIQGKDGVMADYVTLPVRNLHVIQSKMGFKNAVFTEPLAAACEILEQVDILPEYRILLIGDGKLAQLIARVISLHCDRLQVVGRHSAKLLLLEKLGISTVLQQDFHETDHSYHMVIEATGSWDGWNMAVRYVRPRGFLVLKSTYAGDHSFNPAPLVINEVTLIGSRCGPFREAIYLLKKGLVNPAGLITACLPLSQWKQAFTVARQPDTLKVILEH
jgi:threonine dehydrogenase-like Zn-dependent dehydrogenase